jgi:hypothetical protein
MPYLEDDWVRQAPGHDTRLTEQAFHKEADVECICLMVAYSNKRMSVLVFLPRLAMHNLHKRGWWCKE